MLRFFTVFGLFVLSYTFPTNEKVYSRLLKYEERTSRIFSEKKDKISSPSTLSAKELIQTPEYLKALPSRSLDDIMEELDDVTQEDIPEDVMKIVQQKIEDNAPSRLEVMKDILGINKFTVALALASGFLFLLNFIFGDGWAGVLLGYNPSKVEFDNSLYNPANQEKIQQMQLNNQIPLEDAIRRFKILEQDENAFENEGGPKIQFDLNKADGLKIPDFIKPEND
eukprot:gene12847-14076_t